MTLPDGWGGWIAFARDGLSDRAREVGCAHQLHRIVQTELLELLAQPADRRCHLVRDERHPLAHGKRRGRVVQSQRQQREQERSPAIEEQRAVVELDVEQIALRGALDGAGVAAGLALRRRIDRTRATSSRGENGLVT